MKLLPGPTARLYRQHRKDCAVAPYAVENLSDFLAVLAAVVSADSLFWFRGHSDFRYQLMPSALRYAAPEKRQAALDLLSEFRRLTDMKLGPVAGEDADLKWLQLAQHYGLPTRLLDWTENAAVALYFAVLNPKVHGAVFVLNPVTLNRRHNPKIARPLDGHRDIELIKPYLRLTGAAGRTRRKTIALLPVWNSDRLTLQRGVFTLHGSPDFALDETQAPGLMCLPILKHHKLRLMQDLERIGIGEMSIFPETEHVCNYLKRRARLV